MLISKFVEELMEDGRWKMEVGSWKLEVGRWKLEDGSWKMEDGSFQSQSQFSANPCKPNTAKLSDIAKISVLRQQIRSIRVPF